MLDRFGNWYPDFPGQQPHQDPAYMRMHGQQYQQNAPQDSRSRQMLTPPTIRAEIVQVDDLPAIDRFPMAAGTSQMFITRDESNIVVRSMYANGQHTDDIYDRRPPAPPAPTLNPAEYVRKDELQALITEALHAQAAQRRAPIQDKEAEQ